MSNFEFIKKHQPVLSELGAWAEKYTYSDPQSAITKLRCFGELYVAFLYEVFTIPNEGAQTFFEKLTNEHFKHAVEDCVVEKLHAIRMKGNNAAHPIGVSVDDAIWLVKEAYFLSAWLYVACHEGSIEELPKYLEPEAITAEEILLKQDKACLEKTISIQTEDLKRAREELAETQSRIQQAQQQLNAIKLSPNVRNIAEASENSERMLEAFDFEEDETRRRISIQDVFSEYQLTDGQSKLVDRLGDFLDSKEDKVFLLKGYAGTGKTFVTKGLTEYFQAIKRNYILSAPTGKASKVIANKTKSPAYTIHKTIYSFKDIGDYRDDGVDGTQTYKFYSKLAVNEDSVDTVYIVDEASMVSDVYSEAEFFRFGSGRLLKDFLTYVNLDHNDHSKKVIFIGDDAQLPPVGMNNSPALNNKYLLENHHLNTIFYELTEVVRQKAESGIMDNANMLRNALEKNIFNELDFDLSKPDVIHVDYADLVDLYMETSGYRISGESIIIAHSNADVADYNHAVRQVFFPGVEEVAVNDKVMAVNNSDAAGFFISNGDFGQVKQIYGPPEVRSIKLKKRSGATEEIETKEVDLVFRHVRLAFRDLGGEVQVFDTKIIETLLYSKEPSLSSDESKALYVDFCIRHPRLKPRTKEFTDTLRSDPYFNAFRLKFGYAITCHKAQGSEWNNVFVKCKTYQSQLSSDYFRWLYTAITRTAKNLYVLDEPHLNLLSKIKVKVYPVLNKNTAPTSPVSNVIKEKHAIDDEALKFPTLNSNIEVDYSFGTSFSPFLSNLLLRIRETVEPHGVSIINICHQNYQEQYFFSVEGEEVRINIFYNGKEHVSNLLAHNPSNNSAFIISLLDPLKGKNIAPVNLVMTDTFDFSESFLKDFHEEVQRILTPYGITISDLKQNNYCQRYSFIKNGEVAVFDMYYNNKKQFKNTIAQPNLTTSVELLVEISALLNQG